MAAEDHLERARAAHEPRQTLGAAAAGKDSQGHFGLGEDRAAEGTEAQTRLNVSVRNEELRVGASKTMTRTSSARSTAWPNRSRSMMSSRSRRLIGGLSIVAKA